LGGLKKKKKKKKTKKKRKKKKKKKEKKKVFWDLHQFDINPPTISNLKETLLDA